MSPLALYLSPGACSLAPHILLEELGLPYEARAVPLREKAHLRPEYLRINPRARVPALQVGEQVLTEVSAILTYLADLRPEAGLLPAPGELSRARAHEWMSFLGTSVHIAFAQLWRAERYTVEESGFPAVRQAGRAALERLMAEVDRLLQGRTWALGERYSAVDPYLFVFFLWARKEQLLGPAHAAYAAHAQRMLERPAVQRAMAQEALPLPAPAEGP